MPETSEKTQVQDITGHMKKVRNALCEGGKLHLNSITEYLNLTKMQALTVLSRLEQQGEIQCSQGLWQLK